MFRIGNGYDVHRLAEGRKLILGGVEIPYSLGLLGHSDADVLIHAIADALLGAASLRDIGFHFSDQDPAYLNISSMILLQKVKLMLEENNYQIVNIDSIIIAERPKLLDFIEKMRDNVSAALNLKKDAINIKATTTEGLGFCGEGKGIAAQAVALIKKE